MSDAVRCNASLLICSACQPLSPWDKHATQIYVALVTPAPSSHHLLCLQRETYPSSGHQGKGAPILTCKVLLTKGNTSQLDTKGYYPGDENTTLPQNSRIWKTIICCSISWPRCSNTTLASSQMGCCPLATTQKLRAEEPCEYVHREIYQLFSFC